MPALAAAVRIRTALPKVERSRNGVLDGSVHNKVVYKRLFPAETPVKLTR